MLWDIAVANTSAFFAVTRNHFEKGFLKLISFSSRPSINNDRQSQQIPASNPSNVRECGYVSRQYKFRKIARVIDGRKMGK
jgi:hypothetical protein